MVYCGYMSWSWITIMTWSGRILFWLLLCASFLPGNGDVSSYIRGVPGVDYPNYSSIPKTSFRCSQQLHIPGLYADPETRCQVFHHCYEHRQESFLCPIGTVFNQPIQACDYWYSADCSAAPMYYGSNEPHQVIYDEETGFVPIKNSPEHLLDKMASLYKVNDGFPIPNHSSNEANSFEDNHSFSNRELIVQSKPEIKNRNFIETADPYDRHNIVLDELPEEYEYVQKNEDLEDNIQNFGDSFEGSGELSGEWKKLEGEVLSQAGYLSPSSETGDFDNQLFAILQKEHVEEKTKPHVHSYYKDEPKDHLNEFSHVHHISSKGPMSEEKLVRRYSESNANPYSRKSARRKPIFTIIESQAVTEQSNDKVSDPADQGITSSPTESVSVSYFPESLVTSYKAKRRRQPIMIDLEESLQYNIDSARLPDGGASVSYEVNPQSDMSGVSIAAQEISVKLIPGEANRKRKPVGEYLFNYNKENEEETTSSTVSYATSLASNIHYEATTFPTFKEFETNDEVLAVNFNRVNSIRKKNTIRIVDSDDNHVGSDYGKQEDTPFPILKFEDETRLIEEDIQDFEDHFSDTFEGTKEISEQELMSEVSLKEDPFETDPSYFITEHDTEKPFNIVPDTHDVSQEALNEKIGPSFQKSDGLDESYISQMNRESSLEMDQFVGDGDLDGNTDSITLKSSVGFDLTTYDDLQDETYLTTEPASEISTSIPLNIQSTEDSASKFYLISQSNFESEYDHFGIYRNTLKPVPVTFEGNHVRGLLESGSFDLHPPYHIFLEDSIRDKTTEVPHSEDVEFLTVVSDSFESDTEIELFPNAELTENILYHNNRISVSSKPQDIANNNFAPSEEMSTASDLLLDAEHKDNLSHPNPNLDSTATLGLIFTESNLTEDTAVRDVTAGQSSETQRHLIAETDDFDAMKEQDDGVRDQTVLLELSTNPPHAPEMLNTDKLDSIDFKDMDYKGDTETENIQGFIDLSNDFSEMSKPVPPFTINSILEKSENPLFWNNINAFKNNVGIKADPSQVIDDYQLKNTEKPIINKAHSVLLSTSADGMKNVKTIPLRSSRTLTSPHQMGFNMEAFGSRYLDVFPSSMLSLKQNSVQKLLPYSEPAFEDGAFYARTGAFLDSPKISKLISIGKNLLRSKKAKFRILSKYVNSFKSNQ